MKNNWNIFGLELEAGEKRELYINTEAKCYELPVTLCCGVNEGKTLLVTAQIHSHENNGTPASIRAAKSIDTNKLSGNVIFIHCVNIGGFVERYPRVMPEEDFNLNDNFPNKEGCFIGNALAKWFINQVFPSVDFICDLHGGSMDEPLSPCLFFLRNSEESFEAAKKLDVPTLIASDATTGMYSYAYSKFNIPGVLLERGWGVNISEEWIEGHKRNIYLLMEHLDMYDWGMKDNKYNHKKFNKSVYIDADKSALWYPEVKEGMFIKKGQVLGHTEDFFGNVQDTIIAEDDGFVYYYTAGLSAQPGVCLVAYGLIDESEDIIMQEK